MIFAGNLIAYDSKMHKNDEVNKFAKFIFGKQLYPTA